MEFTEAADHPGIYKITNTVNGRIYIGSSVRPIKHRWNGRYNSFLTRSFKRYGLHSFKFEVVINCAPSECLIYEQIFLDHYAPWVDTGVGYNFRRKASSSLGSATSIVSELDRAVRRKSLAAAAQRRYLMRKGSEGKKKYRVAVEAINVLTGEIIKYQSIAAAMRDGFWHGCISNCLKKSNLLHKGFYWRPLIT